MIVLSKHRVGSIAIINKKTGGRKNGEELSFKFSFKGYLKGGLMCFPFSWKYSAWGKFSLHFFIYIQNLLEIFNQN